MEQTFDDYLKSHKCKGFRPIPSYIAAGDYITFYFRDVRCYEQRVDDLLSVFLSMETNELVGCKIYRVKHILQKAGEYGLTPEGAAAKLGLLFFYGAATAKHETQKNRYEELARYAKDAELDQRELLAV